MALTPTQMLTHIRSLSYDAEATLITDDEIYVNMSLAETEIAEQAGCSEATTTDISIIDQREYDSPTDNLKIISVYWDSVKLKKIIFDKVAAREGYSYGGSAQTGNVVYYYEFADKIGFSPIPDEAKTIKYYYVLRPTALTSASTSFTIPNEYTYPIIDYVLNKVFTKDQQKGEGDRAYQLWLQGLNDVKDKWAKKKLIDKNESVRMEENDLMTEIGLI